MTIIQTILGIALFVFLPSIAGFGLLRLIGRAMSFMSKWELLAPCFGLGMILWTLLSLCGYLIGLTLHFLLAAYLLLTIALLLLPRLTKLRVSLQIERNVIDLPLLISVGILSVAYYFVGTYQDPSADSFRHLMFVQKIFEQGVLSSDIFIFSSNVPYNLLNGNYSFDGLYPLYASISKMLSIDPAVLWFHMPAVMIPILVSAYVFIAARLFKDQRVIIALPIVMFCYWAFIGNGLRTVGQPFLVSFVVYATLLPFLFRSLERDQFSLVQLVLYSMGGASIFLLHSQWWAFFGFSLGALGLYLLIRRDLPSFFKTAGLVLGMLIFSVPVFLIKYQFYGQVAGSINEVIFDRFADSVYHFGDLYAFKVSALPLHTTFFGLIAIATLAYVIAKGYKNVNSGGILTALLIGLIIFSVINPLIVPLISELATINTLWRLIALGNIWGIFLLSFAAASLWPAFSAFWARLTSPKKLLASVVGAVGVLAIFLIRPLLQFVVGIQSPAVRQRVALILTETFGIPEELLRTLVTQLPLVAFGGSLAIAVIILLFFLFLRHPISGLINRIERVEPQHALNVSLPFVLIVLLLIPSTEMSPFKAHVQDNLYAQLYGPTLSQVSGNQQFDQMFDILPQGSLITTDARNLLLAHRDLMITGDIHGLIPEGRDINDYIDPIFDINTPHVEVLERLIVLKPEYLILSPRYSSLSWMKYDSYSGVLSKIYDEAVHGIDYYNKRFVIYEVDVQAAQQAIKNPGFETQSSETTSPPAGCDVNRLYAPYAFDLEPSGWNPKGIELLDGIWDETTNSLLWVPARETWFYIEFDLGSEHYIDRVEVKNHHFSSSYHLNALRLYMSEDRATHHFVGEIELGERLSAGDHVWSFDSVGQNGRSLRIAIQSESSTTIGEIEIYGCLI